MLNIKTISILALAGTAVAAPQGWGQWGNYFGHGGDNDNDNGNGNDKGNDIRPVDNHHENVAYETEVVTAYTTVFAGGHWGFGGQAPSPTAEPVAASPVAASPVAAYTHSKPAEQPAESSPAPVASSNSGGYMGIVETWRSKMGLSALTQDSKLQGNALKTAQDGNGQMVHQLNPGSMAQVLAPGSESDFEHVFVGGWLCERPGLKGLDGVCSSMSKGWSYEGQTGHADILSSGKYSKIGCACAGGIWSCDLA